MFDNATFTIKRGDKVAFVGKNGEGKSTLVKCIMGQIPFTGNLKIGHNVKIDILRRTKPNCLMGSYLFLIRLIMLLLGIYGQKIRDILGAFMFGGEASEKK